MAVTAASTSCILNTNGGYTFNSNMAMVIFNSLGIIFLVTGLFMIYKTKRHFKQFYQEYKCYLWFATSFLSIPLFFRATIILLYTQNHSF